MKNETSKIVEKFSTKHLHDGWNNISIDDIGRFYFEKAPQKVPQSAKKIIAQFKNGYQYAIKPWILQNLKFWKFSGFGLR